MKAKLPSRIIVAAILGITLACVMNRLLENDRLGGRDAFFAKQTQIWEQYRSHPHNLVIDMFIGISLAVAVFGINELLVAGVHHLLTKSPSKDNRS